MKLELCFDIIYQHTKFELNPCSLSKVIERTPIFDDGRMHARTGVTLNAPPPFFEWRGHKNLPNPYSEIVLRYNSLYNMWDNMIKFEKGPLLRYIVWQELLHRLTAIYLKRGESLHLLPNTHILKQLLKQYYVHFKIYFKHTMYSSCKQCSCCQLGR